MSKILDGKWVRDRILADWKDRVIELARTRRAPGLAVVLVGNNPASEIYVRNKIKACEELGIYSEKLTPPESVTTEELLQVVDSLNRREDIDGILVQMPLPRHINPQKVIETISVRKDVDGFSVLLGGRAGLGPAGSFAPARRTAA